MSNTQYWNLCFFIGNFTNSLRDDLWGTHVTSRFYLMSNICLNLMQFVLWQCLSYHYLSLWHFSQHPFALIRSVTVFPKGDVGGIGCKGAGVMVGVTLLPVARLQSPGWKASWTGCYGDITNVKGEWSLEGNEHTHTLCPWCSRVNASSRAESAVAMTMRDRNS